MFEIKYRVHEPGRCEKCGKDCEKLFNVVVSSDDKSREYVLCNVCAHDFVGLSMMCYKIRKTHR